MERLPLFVYGSLLPGLALWPVIEPHVIRTRPGSVAGTLHWHQHGPWPLLLPSETGRVRGELFVCAPSSGMSDVLVREEIVYGYDLRWVGVDLDDAERVEALALVWCRDELIGSPIPTGDFRAAWAARG